MRIHTDTLTLGQLYDALPSGVHAYISSKGSRKRDHAFEVTLYVQGKDGLHRRYGNSGGYGSSDDVAATWDEWGIWMAKLYQIDSNALIGWYSDYADFINTTRRVRDFYRDFRKPESLGARTHTAPWLGDSSEPGAPGNSEPDERHAYDA